MGTSTRWQYLVVKLPRPHLSLFRTVREEDIQKELDKHGALGWELVQVVMPPTPAACSMLVLKRPA